MEKHLDDSKIHEGHRGRMRAKLISHGQSIFDSYELLEMLLYHTVPYKDTNPIAKRLLYAFGGLDGVFMQSEDKLVSVPGVGERTAKLICDVGRLSNIIGAEILSGDETFLSTYKSVGEYVTRYFKGKEECSVIALFLDSSMRLVKMKTLYNVDYESGAVRAKSFIDEAVNSRASVVISAHNHPHGPFFPTEGDRATNALITDSLNAAGFIHAEHFLVCGDMYAGIGSINNFTSQIRHTSAVAQFLEDIHGEVGRIGTCDADKFDDELVVNEVYNVRDFDYFINLLKYDLGEKAEKSALELMKKYSTIENVFTAAIGEIAEIVGERCAVYIKLLAYVTSRRRTEKFAFGKVHSKVSVAEYFKALFIGESVEKIYIMTFDYADRVSGCHLLAVGTVSSSDIMSRKAIEIALGARADSVTIAHNHPFGLPRPSSDDIASTHVFCDLFNSCDIRLRDHFVVAGQLCDTIFFEN